MMMISVKKSRILEIYKLTHMRKKGKFLLFRLAKKQNGLVSRERTRGFYNIMNVVLSLFHMRQKIQKGVRFCKTLR